MYAIYLVSFMLGLSSYVSANFCSKRLVKGKWVSVGNCEVSEQEILSNLKPKEAKGQPVTAAQCRKLSGLIAYGKCFIAPVLSANRSTNYTDAGKTCKQSKTLLAEIHDASQQTRIHDFLYSKMPSGLTYFYVWIGMKNNYKTKMLEYRSGKQVPHDVFRWDALYPYKQKTVSIEIGDDGDSSVGFWNPRPSAEMNGVLCETDIL